MDFKLPENTTMIADTARRYLKENYSFDSYIAQLNESNHLEANRLPLMTGERVKLRPPTVIPAHH